MEEQKVEFKSGGLSIAGRMARPAGMLRGERRPAFIVLHGFGSNKNGTHVQLPSVFLKEQGYVTMRFDMRGCGESAGEPGRVICMDQVEDTRNALTFLHRGPGAWQRFTNMLAKGSRHRERTGRSLMVSRFDIVPMPESLRPHMAPGSIMQFPAETAQSMFAVFARVEIPDGGMRVAFPPCDVSWGACCSGLIPPFLRATPAV